MWTLLLLLLLLLSLSLRKKEVGDEESGWKLWFKTSEPRALRLTQSLIYHRTQNRIQRETAIPQTTPMAPHQGLGNRDNNVRSSQWSWPPRKHNGVSRPRGHILSRSCLCCALKRKFLLWQLGHPGPSNSPTGEKSRPRVSFQEVENHISQRVLEDSL